MESLSIVMMVAGVAIMLWGLVKVASMPAYRCSVCGAGIGEGDEVGCDFAHGGQFLCAECGRGRRGVMWCGRWK